VPLEGFYCFFILFYFILFYFKLLQNLNEYRVVTIIYNALNYSRSNNFLLSETIEQKRNYLISCLNLINNVTVMFHNIDRGKNEEMKIT
jgi:hypothetical protein